MATINSYKVSAENWLGNDSYLAQRKVFQQCKSLPRYDELKQLVGAPLTELIFQYGLPQILDPHELEILNEKRLVGPQEPLWSSPSEQLQGKLKLDLPLTRRANEVFTYQNILIMGEEIEKKFEEATSIELQKKITLIHEQMQKEFEDKFERRKDKLKREMYELYSLRLKEVFYKLFNEFKEYIEQREHMLIEHAEKSKREALDVVKKGMEDEINEVAKHLENTYKMKLNFISELKSSEEREDYLQKLNMMSHQWSNLVKTAQLTAEQKQTELIDYLQDLYRLNLLQVIALERSLSNRMIEETVYYFMQRIGKLRDQIHQLYYSLMEANDSLKKNKIELVSWECLLRDVIRQFQKFVNYVLEAVPGEAEYLLTLDKLLERRKQMFDERLKNVGKTVADFYPAEWERLSAKDSVTTDNMSAVIRSITDFIFYKGTVKYLPKVAHAGVKEKEAKDTKSEESFEVEKEEIEEEKSTIMFPLSSELTTTISPMRSTFSGISTDKTYLSVDKYTPPRGEGIIQIKDFMMMGEDGFDEEIGEDIERSERELFGAMEEIPELEDNMILEEEWLYGQIENFVVLGEERSLPEQKSPPSKKSQPVREKTKVSTKKIPRYIKNKLFKHSASVRPSQKIASDSSFISSEEPEKCEDGTIKQTKSQMNLKAEKYDLTLLGTEAEPTPPDKQSFIQGRILSILDIMKAHPQLHNVLIEP